jgi:hypothetical protein
MEKIKIKMMFYKIYNPAITLLDFFVAGFITLIEQHWRRSVQLFQPF